MADYIRHERERWGYMDHRQLLRRLGKITTLTKLECFVSQAEAVARRVSPTNVIVSIGQATDLLTQAMNRARELGFTSLEHIARNMVERLNTTTVSRPMHASTTLSPEMIHRQRAITLSQQLPSLQRTGFEALFRARVDFTQDELMILLDFFGEVLSHQFDGTYAITKGDAGNFCHRVRTLAYANYWGPISDRADALSKHSTMAPPQPRPTHRIVRIRKREK